MYDESEEIKSGRIKCKCRQKSLKHSMKVSLVRYFYTSYMCLCIFAKKLSIMSFDRVSRYIQILIAYSYRSFFWNWILKCFKSLITIKLKSYYILYIIHLSYIHIIFYPFRSPFLPRQAYSRCKRGYTKWDKILRSHHTS